MTRLQVTRLIAARGGNVTLGATPSIVLYAGLPAASLAGGVTEAFGSLWVTDFDAGNVQRHALPTP